MSQLAKAIAEAVTPEDMDAVDESDEQAKLDAKKLKNQEKIIKILDGARNLTSADNSTKELNPIDT